MPPTMRKRAPPQPHSVIVASTSSKRPSAAGKKPAKRPTESQKNGTVPDEAFNIDLLPAVVWVRVEGDERYGWWPGKIIGNRDTIPLLIERFGGTEPSTISLAQPSTTSLLPFRHVRSAELRAAGADLPGFMDAMQMALDAETADDDGLPSLEKIISTPKKAKPEADKKGKKTKSAKKVRAEKEEEVRQDDMENPFAVSVANSSKGDRNDDYDDDFDFFAQNKDETLEIPGELVFAYYSEDKKYYPAKILEYFLTNGKYKVLYFDGAQRSLPRNRFYAMTERDFATCKVGETTSHAVDPDYENSGLRANVMEMAPALRRVVAGQDIRAWRMANFHAGGSARRVLARHVGQGPLDNEDYAFVWKVLREMFVPEAEEARRGGRKKAEVERMKVDPAVEGDGSGAEAHEDVQGTLSLAALDDNDHFSGLSPAIRLSIVSDVLLPETVIRLIMKDEGLEQYEEAERRMMEGYGDKDDRWVERIWAARSAFGEGMRSLGEKRRETERERANGRPKGR